MGGSANVQYDGAARVPAQIDPQAAPRLGSSPYPGLPYPLGATPYQGMTPVAGSSLAECAETYFAQSEQLPTRFALAMGEASAPGRSSRTGFG